MRVKRPETKPVLETQEKEMFPASEDGCPAHTAASEAGPGATTRLGQLVPIKLELGEASHLEPKLLAAEGFSLLIVWEKCQPT